MSRVRTISLGLRPKSHLALKVFAFLNCVRPITTSCIGGSKNYLADTIIMTRRCVGSKKHVARLKVKVIGSQSALKVCAFKKPVQPITSSYIVGFKNYLTEMVILTRQRVACKNMLLGQNQGHSRHLKFVHFTFMSDT